MVKLEKRLDQTFAALSDPTRRSILWRLRRGSLTVNELAQPYGVSLAAVSKHLKVLEAARLIRRRRQGRKFLISLAAGPLNEAEKWLEFYREFWEASLDQLSDYVDSKKGKQR